MAILHKKHNANAGKRAGFLAGQALCVLVPAALAVWYVVGLVQKQPLQPVLYAALACAAVGAVLFRVFGNRSEILKSGIEGEKQAMDALKVLPYSYHVVSNPVYYINGRKAELDAVVIGKNGVCIVETKNHTGVITGRPQDEWWSQTKRRGTKHMKNPLLQVERQAAILEQVLREAGCKCEVRQMVYFASKSARVSVRDKRIFVGEDALRKAIRAEWDTLSPSEVSAIVDALTWQKEKI